MTDNLLIAALTTYKIYVYSVEDIDFQIRHSQQSLFLCFVRYGSRPR